MSTKKEVKFHSNIVVAAEKTGLERIYNNFIPKKKLSCQVICTIQNFQKPTNRTDQSKEDQDKSQNY